MTYPATREGLDLEKYKDVPNATIAKDIDDTEEEIARLRLVRDAEEVIALNSLSESERQMASFKAAGRPEQIAERERFVAFLRLLQEARNAGAAVTT